MNKLINLFIPKSKRIDFAIQELLYYYSVFDKIPKANIKTIDELRYGFYKKQPYIIDPVCINKRKISKDYDISMPESSLSDLLYVIRRIKYPQVRIRLKYPLFLFFYDYAKFIREMYDGCFNETITFIYE